MKIRSSLLIILTLTCLAAKAQPPETVYEAVSPPVAVGFKQNIPLASDGPFPIGFNFTFYGNSYSQFYVSANGLVMFTDPDGFYSTEATIPTASSPNNYIAPFWDNLSIMDVGKILYKTIGASPNRKCIIQFTAMGFDPVTTPLGTFFVILYESTNVIQIQYRLIVDPYSPNSHGASATIGIENSTGTDGSLYAYHDGDAVHSGGAISFTPSGPNYIVNSSAVYDGVFLTTNITLPDPGITSLISPASDAVIGSSQTFQWAVSPNANSYILVIDTLSNLATASYYYPGSNLSYDISGLLLGKTYYWAVFSSNATATTWCEVRRFSTSSNPPLAPVPQTVWTEQGQDKTIKLEYTGGDASAKTAIVTSLPAQGQLYQYNSGSRGSQITSVPATVTDAGRNVIYAAAGGTGNGVGNFNFKINDAGGDSPEGTITVNVSPPGIPSVLYTAKSTTYVEIQLDRAMNDPSGKQNQFEVKVNGSPVTISSASLKTGDNFTILLTLASSLTGSETVLVSYTQGDVTSSSGGFLLSFTDQPVTLTAQTINFTQTLDKKFNESPFTITATASSGLSLTYNSSNTSVATFAGSVVTLQSTGTSTITLRQLGNATFAPARHARTLTVSKGDQTITFNVIPVRTYGDPDFSPGATASSGLPVSYSSDNPAVATIISGMIHITGAGSATITASQAGSSLWNPAPDFQRTLTVSKASQTIAFNALPVKTYGDADFSPGATSSSGLNVSYYSDNTAVATIDGGMIHITGAGSANITASQAGDANYNPAPDVIQPLTVNKAAQTITFSPLPAKTYGDADFSPGAASSSGLTVSYSSDNTAVATIAGGMIHITGAGSANITASQSGNTNFNAAADVVQPLVVSKSGQTIIFTAIPDRLLIGDTFTLEAVASSGLTVSFESQNPAFATVAGSLLTGVTKGTATIRAFNNGDQNYNPAETSASVDIVSTHRDIMHLFTPNGDGINDYWELPDLQEWGKCEVKVYNRWGKLVYDNADYDNLWDGTSDGKPVPEGPYYFIIKTENAGIVKGNVNIVR